MDVMEEKQFKYVENFNILMFSQQKLMSILTEQQRQYIQSQENEITYIQYENEESTEIENQSNDQMIILKEKQDYIIDELMTKNNQSMNDFLMTKTYPDQNFCTSKYGMLMFRRQEKNTNLELRHQRTSDVVFDIIDEDRPYEISYKILEFVYNLIETLLPKAKYEYNQTKFKMMELWADEQRPRKGWISLVEKEKSKK